MDSYSHLLNRPVTMDLHVKTICFPKVGLVRGFAGFTGIDSRGNRVFCTGYFPGLSAGMPVRVNGTWQLYGDRKYGNERLQIRADGYDLLDFTNTAEISRFLEGLGAEGCGPKTIEKIIGEYGQDTVREITDAPDRFVERHIPGVSRKARISIRDAATDRLFIHEGYAFLIKAGFPDKAAASLADRFGRETGSIFQRDPYSFPLACLDITFDMVDRILLQNRMYDAVSADRIASGIMHKLRTDAAAGHVYSEESEVKAHVSRILGLTRSSAGNLRNTFRDAVGKLYVSRAAESDGKGRFYLHGRKDMEREIASMLYTVHMNSARNPYPSPGKLFRTGYDLSFEQKKAVWTVFERPLSIITGGPGTGKSYITRIIYEAASNAGLFCMAAAPTGKAARRLDNAIFGAAGGSEDLRPQTLHRLLHASDGKEKFRMNSRNRLPYDLLIIDESSMIDIELVHALLSAVSPKARIVFIGDADQLPPVGQGNFFSDMIASGCIPVTRLSRIFRQDKESGIVMNAERINRGEFPMCAGKFGLKGDDFFFFECGPVNVVSRLLSCVSKELPEQYGLNPVRDIQVLTPVNGGALGTAKLNTVLRETLNPRQADAEDYAIGDCTFRTGDKVMQTVNDYSLKVFNGDTGYISGIDNDLICVFFPDYGRSVTYTRRQARFLTLAYAVTIHKAQGAETGAAVIVLDGSNSVNAVRKQIYTAVTRARKAVVLIGERAAYLDALSDRNAVSRNTELTERIRDRFIV